MKSKIPGTVLFAALTMSAGGALAEGPVAERIAAGEPIRLGFAAAAPWAHPGENGEPLGLTNIITIDVLERMGHTDIEPVVTDWAGLIPSLMAGRVDIITGGMYILNARCKNVDFSEPIGQFGQAFIVREDGDKSLDTYEAIRDADVVVAGVAGYANIVQAQEAGIDDANIMQLPGLTEVLAAVNAGRAAVGTLTAIEAVRLARVTDGIHATDSRALPPEYFNWVGVGFHPDDDEFRTAFNEVMQDGYLGSDEMMAGVAEFDFVEANLPDDTTTQWACANR